MNKNQEIDFIVCNIKPYSAPISDELAKETVSWHKIQEIIANKQFELAKQIDRNYWRIK